MAPFLKTVFVQGSAPAATAAELNNFGDGIVEAQRAPFVTALPTTGPGGGALADGQQCFYKPDPTNAQGNGNVTWHMKYESSSGKWYCIGGPPFYRGPTDASDIAATGTFLTPAGSPATYTIPFPGDWEIAFGHASWANAANAQIDAGIRINGAAPSSQKLAMAWNPSANLSQQASMLVAPFPGLAAASTIDLGIRTSVSSGKPRNLWFAAKPIKVG